MVVFQQKKRSKAPLATDGMANLTDLPIELLFQVLGDLDNLSVLRLRLTCSAMRPSCDTALQQRLKTLYCHPSAKAMKHALSICNHPVFSQTIEEVVLMGKIVWRDIEWAYPGYREGYSESGMFARPAEVRAIRKALDDDAGRFCFWPRESYDALLDALSQLPNLHRLAFAEAADSSGWNQVSSAIVDAHYHKYSSKDQKASGGERLTDADAFYGLLSHPHLTFTSCRLSTELPFADGLIEQLIPEIEEYGSAEGSWNVLETLDIVIDCGWVEIDNDPPSLKIHRLLLEECRETLQSLNITIKANISKRALHFDYTLENLLWNKKFHKLETLSIQLGQVPNQQTTRRHRPLCNGFELNFFVANHRDSLKTLILDNVTFFSDDMPVTYSVLDTIRRLTQQKSTFLERIEWRINHHRHDPRCTRPESNDPTRCRNLYCGYYEGDRFGEPLTVADFESLAQEIGVGLDPEQMAWDFGQAVKRTPQLDDS